MAVSINKLARKSLSLIEPYVPGKPAEVLFREKGISRIIKLASNENPFGPSPEALKAIKKKLSGINRYPEGSAFELKEKLACLLKTRNDQIIVGNGSSEIISMAIQSFCEPGDEIVFPSPSFIIYKILAHAFGAIPVTVKLNSDMRYNIESFFEKISGKTKIVILCNPNNPTGSHINKKQLEKFMKNIPERIVILSDEAYFEYAEDPQFGSCIDWLGRKNVIVTRTFSKIYGLAGLRIGYGIATQDIIKTMEKIRPPFNTTSLAQYAALAAIDDHVFVEKSLINNRKEKKFLAENLKNLGFNVFPSQANFIFCSHKLNAGTICKELEEKGIILRPMAGFGMKDNFIRITIGKPFENRLLIKELRSIIARGGYHEKTGS
ncbi:MAG: histidinol-phosphate transaminase [Candidatus Omnitrophica bacterium]|nr:histidinol-phosphate transaminase [Candidatus Omnitrophota bacterium]MCM8828032.1 histidinol-phosphate transaminase [Candidatus Omnitrophota bacterium]